MIVAPVDGVAYGQVLKGATTQIGLYLELDGAAVAADATPTLTLRRGDLTVSLTPTISTSGEVTASVSAANLTTLSAGIGDSFSAFWDGTVGSGARKWEYEQVLVVTDRIVRFTYRYDDLKIDLPWINNSAVVPSGQSNLWPQARAEIERCRDELYLDRGGVLDYMLTNPAQLRLWIRLRVMAELCRWGSVNDSRQGGLEKESEKYAKHADAIFGRLQATVKTGTSEFGTTTGEKVTEGVTGRGVFQPFGVLGGYW